MAVITGTSGSDRLVGTSVDDILVGSLGNDVLDGALDIDIADYSSLSESISLQKAGVARKKSLITDQILGIETTPGKTGKANTINTKGTSLTTSFSLDTPVHQGKSHFGDRPFQFFKSDRGLLNIDKNRQKWKTSQLSHRLQEQLNNQDSTLQNFLVTSSSLSTLRTPTKQGRKPTGLSNSDNNLRDTTDYAVSGDLPDVKTSITQKALNSKALETAPELNVLECYVTKDSTSQPESLVNEGLLVTLPMDRLFTNVGAVTSQADFVLEANRVRTSLPTGFDGTGVRIGVLSDSYNNLRGEAADIASRDLPAGVGVIQELTSGGSDEGRAMLQLIHDLAPGSTLSFATAGFNEFNSEGITRKTLANAESTFANNIRSLAAAGCKVIVDDIGFPNEPFFQDGLINRAINDVATNNGVAYFSAAGNRSRQAYESTSFNAVPDSSLDAKLASLGFTSPGLYYDFNLSSGVDTRQRITLTSGQAFSPCLQWDNPFYTTNGVTTNLDIFLLDSNDNPLRNASGQLLGVSASNNFAIQPSGYQEPYEFFGLPSYGGSTPLNLNVVIRLSAGPAPGRIKYVDFSGNSVSSEYPLDYSTIIPHAAAINACAVAAVPYYDQTTPETFTSQGPSTILFNSDGTRKATPEIRQKPDLAAIDKTDTTFFGSDIDGNGYPNFPGTSAAAPHAAAIAALIKQANPTFTPQQIYDRLKSTARDIGASGFDNVTGAGLINAYDAIFGSVAPTSLPFTDNFEDGDLPLAYETVSTGAGRIQVTTANGSIGTRHLTLDSSREGFNSLNEAILHFNATSASNIELSFAQREFSDEDNPMLATFTGSVDADGVALSVNGTNWFRLFDLTGANSTNTYQTKTINLSTFAAANGLTLGSNVRIKFQQYDNSSITSASDPDGFAFDNISILRRGQLTFSSASYQVNEDGTPVGIAVTIVRTGGSEGAVNVTVTPSNGTAIAPGDFTNTPIVVSFADGQTSSTMVIPIVNDTLVEPSETINLALSNSTGGATIGTQSTATLTVIDNDVQLAFSAPSYQVNENGTVVGAAVTITRTGRSQGVVGVTVTPSNGTAIAPGDFTNTPIVVSFADGQTSSTMVIPIINDTLVESNETINLTLSNPTGGATIGTQSTTTLAIIDDDTPYGFSINGEAAGDRSGLSVNDAGDINGDGFADLIVAAPYGGDGNLARSYVVFGNAGNASVNLNDLVNNNTLGFILNGGGDSSRFPVSNAGDVNGDGLADLVIGAPNFVRGLLGAPVGKSYVAFGKTTGTAVTLDNLSGTSGFIIDGENSGDKSGLSVSNAGDVNGDGLDDLIVGTAVDNTYVVFGKNNGVSINLSNVVAGSGGFVIRGETLGDNSGFSVSNAGDVNGDGLADLVVGAPKFSSGGLLSPLIGKSYVVFGKTNGSTVNLSSIVNGIGGFVINGEGASNDQFGDRSGYSVSGAGDINGDGLADLVIGAPRAGSSVIGKSYVVFGKNNGTTAINLSDVTNGVGGFVIRGEALGDNSGSSVSNAGDVNGDGLDDLIIGASTADPVNKIDAGRSYVIFGKSNGTGVNLNDITNGIGGFSFNGETANDNSGRSVSSAGDVNGDGFADLVIGAPSSDPNGRTDAGKSYIVYGSGSVNQLGGIGSDSLTGTANGQSLIGAQGNDTLSDGGFTNTVLYGGTGDDILRISNANFKRINGGLGNDTLALNGSGFNLDLTGTSDNTKLISLETIDLTGTGNNSLTLNIGAIRNLVSDIRSSVGTGSAGFRRLTVLGNSGDALTANLTGLSFVRGLNTPVGFTTYTSGNLQLTVNNAVTQTGITV
jgi:hypothetical protein